MNSKNIIESERIVSKVVNDRIELKLIMIELDSGHKRKYRTREKDFDMSKGDKVIIINEKELSKFHNQQIKLE